MFGSEFVTGPMEMTQNVSVHVLTQHQDSQQAQHSLLDTVKRPQQQ